MNRLYLVLKGMAMGMAEVIPGVSGGTLAYITGIYEELINTIKSFDLEVFSVYSETGLRGLYKHLNIPFLIPLMMGMAGGVVIGIFGITYLLEEYPLQVWGFFFGLILASVYYVGSNIEDWRLSTFSALFMGAAMAYYVTVASPMAGSDSLVVVFLSGLISISAFILPGVSGSFILLLLGMYTLIIPTIKDILSFQDFSNIPIVIAFGLGCAIGLAFFSRLLSWAFDNYSTQINGLLCGFMLGSLNKIWPWRNVIESRTNSRGLQVPFIEESVWPSNYLPEPEVTSVVIFMLLGLLLILSLLFLDKKKKNVSIKEKS